MSRLTTYFGSDTSGMERGLNRAQGHVARFSSNVRRNLFRAFAVGALIAQLRGISQELDRIDKLSKRFGVGTGFLQDLDQQAKLSGASLEEAAKAMSRLVREVNKPTVSKEIGDAIHDIKLNIEDLKGLNAEQLLAIIAETIGGLGDNSIQTARAMDLLGRSGGELVPLLQDIYENGGLADAPKQTQAAIDATVKFNDAMTNLGAELKTVVSPGIALVAFLIGQIVRTTRLVAEPVGILIGTMIEGWSNLGKVIKSALKLDMGGIKEALTAQRALIASSFDMMKENRDDWIKETISEFKKLANELGGSFDLGEPSGPTDGGPRERTGTTRGQDSDGPDNERTVTALQREEMGLVQSIKRLQDAMTDPRNMGVSSIQRVGGGGTANLPNQDASLRVQNKQLAELARIREAILAAQGGTIR